MKQVAIFIPGIMGSELYLNDQLIWPGPLSSLIFKYKLMPQLIRSDLRVGDIIRRVSVSEQYGALINDLNLCGFEENQLTLYVCPYDWRKKNEDAAEILARKIENATQDHKGDLRISIIAHSMGGLVSRYYLESGLFDKRGGFGNVSRLITLATPHRGSPLALTAAMGLEKRVFLSKEQVCQLVSMTEYPSLYQLMPPRDESFAWDDRDTTTEFDPFPVYESAKELNLNSNNLQAALDFRAKLDVMACSRGGIRYFFFTGTRMPTLANVRIQRDADNKLAGVRIELEDAGDGTVPSWSSALPGVQGQVVGGEHSTIYKDRGLLRTLGVLLGRPGVLAAAVPSVQLAVRDKVIEPRDSVHVVLTFPAAVQTLQGNLLVREVMTTEDGTFSKFGPIIENYPIRYSGLGAEKLGLMFSAPSDQGVYQIAYSETQEFSKESSDDFFVQSSK